MSFLELDDKEGLGMYIKHDFRLGKFVVNNAEGVEPLDFEYMLIDTDFQTGYGKYDGQYQFIWDQQVGIKPDNAKELVAQDYKRAFSARIYIKDKGVYLWQRFGLLEGQTFDEAMSSAWKDKVDEVASPSQLQVKFNEVEDLKQFKTKAITIFAVVQFAMGAIVFAMRFM